MSPTPEQNARQQIDAALEAAGDALTNVELQADKYATGLPAGLNPPMNQTNKPGAQW